MAGVKISALPAATTVVEDDLLPIVDVSGVVTQKATISQLRAALAAPAAPAGEALSAGQIVCKANDAGTAKLYRAAAQTAGRKTPIGYTPAAALIGADAQVQQFGTINVPDALWDSVPTAAAFGSPVYVSGTTAGNSTITPPDGVVGNALVVVGTVWAIGAGFVTVLIDVGLPGTVA